MKSIKLLVSLLFILLYASCSSNDDKIEFTFLQLNDVYEIAPIQGGAFGGMARVEAIHQQLLKQNKNTFLMMAGDFLNPSLLGTVKYNGDRIRGKQMIEVMNAMNFELAAFGNHEFDLSQKDLQKRLNESTFNWISGNTQLHLDGKNSSFYKVEKGNKIPVSKIHTIAIKDADGTHIKIGFISVCIPSNPKSYVTYSDVYDEAVASYELLKDSVDVVFGLTHVKINQDKKIAKLLPNIPLIMGGHEHTNMKHQVGNTMITKADANAKTAYIHKISYDKKTKKATIVSELKEINETLKPSSRIDTIVNKWQKVLNTQLKLIIKNPNQIIYNAKEPLDGRDTPIRSEQTNLGNIIVEAMSFVYDNKVDCALVNGGSIRIDDVLEGEIISTDIFRVLPYGGAILKVQMKGRLLKKVIGFGKKASGTGAYLQRSNNIQVNGGKILLNGRKIISTKTYTIALSDYLMKGFDIPFLNEKNPEVLSVYKPKKDELGFDIRKGVIEYMLQAK
ncbi:MAG: bifunctional metallophosphatase/5'-nucleotidase [Flavobacteriaceae bacterium]